MEREGRNEANERRIARMQRPANSFFIWKERQEANMILETSDTLSHIQTDRPSQDFDFVNIEPVLARGNPVEKKRKCDLWMDLEDISLQSTFESPAKRRRNNNFEELMKSWDTGRGGGQEQPLKNEPLKQNMHLKDNYLAISKDHARPRKIAKPKFDPATHSGEGGGGESYSEVEGDWSGGGG